MEYRLQNNGDQEDNVNYHGYYCQKQHHQNASKQIIGRYVSFEHSDEIKQQYVQDETKEVNRNMDDLYHQQQNHYAEDNMKQEYDNLNRNHLNQQPGQHAMDQGMPHNMLSEQLNNSQEQNVHLRCGGGFASPLNMYDNGEYDYAHII